MLWTRVTHREETCQQKSAVGLYLPGIQLRTYGEDTTPEASTKEWPGLMIMVDVGTTYIMGGCLAYPSGNQIWTGMLYFTPCRDSGNHSLSVHATP